MPDISVGQNEAPEFAAMARKAVSMMSLEEVLGRMVLEIAVVWVLSGMVRALVDKFGDAARKVTHKGPAAPDLRRLCAALGRVLIAWDPLLAAADARNCPYCGRCCSEVNKKLHSVLGVQPMWWSRSGVLLYPVLLL